MFNEICIYEVKIEKQDEIEALMKEVAEYYLAQQGVIDVKYIKRTHRQKDFNAVKEGEVPIRLTTDRKSNLRFIFGFGERRGTRKTCKIGLGKILQALEPLFDNYAENYIRRKYRIN